MTRSRSRASCTPSYSEVGVVIQSYLRRSAADIDRLIEEQIRVRLCKGAYDEPSSVAFTTKDEVDDSYRELMERLLMGGRYPALATHDEALIEHAIAVLPRQRHRRGTVRVPDALRGPPRPS